MRAKSQLVEALEIAMIKQQEAIRDARELGIPKMLILGLQHMFAMFGATILVPILVNVYFEGEGLSIQVTLICASPSRKYKKNLRSAQAAKWKFFFFS